eukprot:g13255.t1
MTARKRQIRVTERISTEFLQLIEQVLAQHVVEIEDLKAEVEESKRMANHDADPPEQEREVLHFRQTNWSGVEDPDRWGAFGSGFLTVGKRGGTGLQGLLDLTGFEEDSGIGQEEHHGGPADAKAE